MSLSYDDVRAQIDWLCDAMIPGDPELGFPSASETGVPDRLLPMALKTRADLAPAFIALVSEMARQRPPDPLGRVRAAPAEDRALLGRFIAGAYFASPEVMSRLRYPGFQALPLHPDYDEIIAAVAPHHCMRRMLYEGVINGSA